MAHACKTDEHVPMCQRTCTTRSHEATRHMPYVSGRRGNATSSPAGCCPRCPPPDDPQVARVLAEVLDGVPADGVSWPAYAAQGGPHVALHCCHVLVRLGPVQPLQLQVQPAGREGQAAVSAHVLGPRESLLMQLSSGQNFWYCWRRVQLVPVLCTAASLGCCHALWHAAVMWQQQQQQQPGPACSTHSVKACMSGMEPSRGSLPPPSWACRRGTAAGSVGRQCMDEL